MEFAFETLGLDGLKSGHASDNLASGAVLLKLGFVHVGDETLWSKPRRDGNHPAEVSAGTIERDLPYPCARSTVSTLGQARRAAAM